MPAPIVRDSNGPVRLGALLGKGGEGAVYEVVDRPGFVAKIYLRDKAERGQKLEAMRALLTPQIAALTAWPAELLRSSDGRVTGFLMANMKGSKDIHTLYGPKSRLAEFPHADWRMLVRSALNTARAFGVLHESGCLVADVNHGGIRVLPDATVKLIDCDSFQVSTGSKVYLCEVGVENFTPAELQGKPFKQTPRTVHHDNFGLAVMVFHLLMIGRHPFAGRFSGPEDMPIPKAISQFRYAYSTDKSATRMEPPPTAPAVGIAGEEIRAMWELAFGQRGVLSRPSALDWVRALVKLEGSFARCTKSPSHHYLASYGRCPWCPIESIGIALFPLGISQENLASGPFSLDAVWAEIKTVDSPGPTPNPPAPTTSLPSPEAENLGKRRRVYKSLAWASGLGIIAIGFMANADAALLWLIVGPLVGLGIASRVKTVDVLPFEERQRNALANYKYLIATWRSEGMTSRFDDASQKLQKLKEEWLALPRVRQQRYADLVNDRQKHALNRFLDGFKIAKASISGIGPAKKAMLESYGIETAADVTFHSVMQVPGFGPALAQRLLNWQVEMKQRFRFNPNSDVDPKLVAELDRNVRARKNEVERDLVQGVRNLKKTRDVIMCRRAALEALLSKAAAELGRANADCAAIGI